MADYAKKYSSAKEALLDRLSDCSWHPWKELEAVAGNRYAARTLELRRAGYQIENRPSQSFPDGKDYRLMSLVTGAPKPKRVKVFLGEYDAQAIVLGNITPAAKAAVKVALKSFTVNKGKL